MGAGLALAYAVKFPTRTIAVPVLFLHGACDPRPIHFIETLASKLSYSRFASIPESGHYPWVEKPDEVKAALRRFIRSQVM